MNPKFAIGLAAISCELRVRGTREPCHSATDESIDPSGLRRNNSRGPSGRSIIQWEESVLVDHRTYRIKPGAMNAYLDNYEKFGFAPQTRHLG